MGLAIGIAASILIFLIIRNELSYDKYQSKRDRVYRVVTTMLNKSDGEISRKTPGVPPPLPAAMQKGFCTSRKNGCDTCNGRGSILYPWKKYR
jgi:hypothetical protein